MSNSGVCVVLLPEENDFLSPLKDPHVSLIYLGTTDLYSVDEIEVLNIALSQRVDQMRSASGIINGVGIFLMPNEAPPLRVLLVDSFDVLNLRQYITSIFGSWQRIPQEHGFIPHISTWGSQEQLATTLYQPHPVHFDRIGLWAGDFQSEYKLP